MWPLLFFFTVHRWLSYLLWRSWQRCQWWHASKVILQVSNIPQGQGHSGQIYKEDKRIWLCQFQRSSWLHASHERNEWWVFECVCTCMCEREREGRRGRDGERGRGRLSCLSQSHKKDYKCLIQYNCLVVGSGYQYTSRGDGGYWKAVATSTGNW